MCVPASRFLFALCFRFCESVQFAFVQNRHSAEIEQPNKIRIDIHFLFIYTVVSTNVFAYYKCNSEGYNMVNLILMTHGTLADSLKETLSLFFEAENLTALSLDDDPEGMRESLKARLEQGQEFLILVDLFGGTPFNIAASLLSHAEACGKRVELVSGVNLPMLMEVILNLEDAGLDELVQSAQEMGKFGIRDLMAELGRKTDRPAENGR